MKFHIEHTEVFGIDKSMIAAGNSFRTEMQDNTKPATEKDIQRAIKLGQTKPGEGHDQFMTSMIAFFDLYAPLYMWKEIQRYKFLDFVSSQSTMHCLTKFKLSKQCVEDTDHVILNRAQELIDEYNKEDGVEKIPVSNFSFSLSSEEVEAIYHAGKLKYLNIIDKYLAGSGKIFNAEQIKNTNLF